MDICARQPNIPNKINYSCTLIVICNMSINCHPLLTIRPKNYRRGHRFHFLLISLPWIFILSFRLSVKSNSCLPNYWIYLEESVVSGLICHKCIRMQFWSILRSTYSSFRTSQLKILKQHERDIISARVKFFSICLYFDYLL